MNVGVRVRRERNVISVVAALQVDLFRIISRECAFWRRVEELCGCEALYFLRLNKVLAKKEKAST